MWTLDGKANLFSTYPGPIHILADGSPQVFTYEMGNIFLVLKSIVDDFASTSEKIIKELKFNHDGFRMTMLTGGQLKKDMVWAKVQRAELQRVSVLDGTGVAG